MQKSYRLSDGERLDEICLKVYGFLDGAIEDLLRHNRSKLHLFDRLGRVKALQKPEFIVLPELSRPVGVKTTLRIFN